ncbi:MAG: PLP-dependent aminotransferase family protein [Desulfurococcaceae archaeon]
MLLDKFERFASALSRSMRASEVRDLLSVIKRRGDVISLAGGIPDPSLFPKRELAEIARKVIEERGDVALQYGETKGELEARRALVDLMQRWRGFRAGEEDVVITTGSQQGLDLLARTLLDPGDVVITENPTYLAALGAFRAAGAHVVGIRMDSQGMRTDELEAALRRLREEGRKVKFIYVIPVAQNPAGTTMSRDRKRHLLELAEQFDVLVVEDDPYSYLVYDQVDVASLRSMDDGRVLYMSTVSKILSPGLRVGWLVSPEDLSRRFELVKQYLDLHSPTLNQYIVAEAIRSGLIEKVVEKAVPRYKGKRDVMVESLEEEFGEGARFVRPVGGLFVMAYVDEGFDAGKMLGTAVEKYGVAYVPGASFHTDGSGRNSMRLNFSYPSEGQIREGIARLARLVKSSTST